MNKDFEAILDECLDQVNRGESLEACVAQFPTLATELEPMLRLALQLQALRQDQEPSPVALQAGRQKLLSASVGLKRARESQARRGRIPLRLSLQPLMRRSLATIALVALLLVTVLGGGTIAASAKSLPGDALYPVKRLTEEFQLLLTLDREAKAQLVQKLDERRREEAKAIASSQRIAEMAFRGRVESMDGTRWTIAGIAVHTADDTVMEGDIKLDTLVRVQVHSFSDGTLLAVRISAEREEIVPQPTVVPTQPKPTIMPTPTSMPPTEIPATAVPIQLPPSTATASPTSIPSATPSATATPIPATPTPPRKVAVKFTARIEDIAASGWAIGGRKVRISATTRIDEREGKATVGAMATVVAIPQEDDTLLATEITIERSTQPSEQPYEFRGLIESFGPLQWTVRSDTLYTLIINQDTVIEGRPQKGLLAEVKALRQSDGSLLARRIVVQLPGEEVQFEGLIQALSAEVWIVEGITVRVDAETVIVGTAAVGFYAEVQGLVLPDETVLARRIVVQQPSTPTPAPAAGAAPGQAPATPGTSPEPSSTLAPLLPGIPIPLAEELRTL